jgi:hypothetical protein
MVGDEEVTEAIVEPLDVRLARARAHGAEGCRGRLCSCTPARALYGHFATFAPEIQ